ncbi:hypothetical protein OH492_17115 [Vibrio chagasii]|nr:hypothetical protein [Vibrio chagasii]
MVVQRHGSEKTWVMRKSDTIHCYVAFFIHFVFILLGVLFNAYYDGKEFENGNTIILHSCQRMVCRGRWNHHAAILAASMSSFRLRF